MGDAGPTPLIDRIESVFGVRGFPHALFYQFESALRFELGGERESVDRFLEVMNRSRAVASALFAESSRLAVVRRTFSWKGAPVENRPILRLLRDMGVPHRFSSPESIPCPDEPLSDSGDCNVWRELEMEANPRLIEAVLWSALRIWPVSRTPADCLYIVDFDRGLVLWPYDDRGMDVIATNRGPLEEIYRQFGPWLLDYDRARMDAVFAA